MKNALVALVAAVGVSFFATSAYACMWEKNTVKISKPTTVATTATSGGITPMPKTGS